MIALQKIAIPALNHFHYYIGKHLQLDWRNLILSTHSLFSHSELSLFIMALTLLSSAPYVAGLATACVLYFVLIPLATYFRDAKGKAFQILACTLLTRSQH
jgi:hypothetical protein